MQSDEKELGNTRHRHAHSVDESSTRASEPAAARRLRATRLKELEAVLPLLEGKRRILELGAGAGWLSRALSERGYDVDAIDLASSRYAPRRAYDVQDYDGVHIPFPDGHFDAVLSSHVLEHVERLACVQSEIARVLAPEGIALHMLPTSSWRFWSIVSHYLLLPERVLARARQRDRESARTGPTGRVSKRGLWRGLFPRPHGVTGNALTEIYVFSRFRWRAIFRSAGWRILDCRPTRLFTMPFLRFHPLFGFHAMRWPSYVLGSSSLIWILASPRDEGDENQSPPSSP